MSTSSERSKADPAILVPDNTNNTYLMEFSDDENERYEDCEEYNDESWEYTVPGDEKIQADNQIRQPQQLQYNTQHQHRSFTQLLVNNNLGYFTPHNKHKHNYGINNNYNNNFSLNINLIIVNY